MSETKQKIVDFLREHHVVNLAFSDDLGIWCAPLFYALSEECPALIVASDKATRHARAAISTPKIAGSIALESKQIGLLQGLQFEALWERASPDEESIYFLAFPFARAMLPTLWRVKITYAKLTDNRLFFGKKLEFFAK